ncbi:Ff.00g101650.m01.CDS01 [Fusarium sp. VM40]|nr:Ff.00g101650.m01.CDS01 [Fusarium sp. VM40]
METTPRRLQRASAACDFCRRRKLGCDNAKPKCENCQARLVQCTYSKRMTPARPSNARIHKLEEENARLRQQLHSQSPEQMSDHRSGTPLPLQNGPTTSNSTAVSGSPATAINRAHEQPQSIDKNVVSLAYSPTTTGQPEDHAFHGPSAGAMHPSASQAAHNHTDSTGSSAVKNQLLAETTRQRQLENINLRARKLNFGATDPKFGLELLSNFWNRQHYIGSVVYRTAFMRDMACNGPYFSELLLNAILFAGSKHTAATSTLGDISDLNSIGRPFRAKFEQILHGSGSQILLKSEITTIQALLVVADALFSWCNERSLSWHYMGIAINMIVDLGLHIDASSRRSSKKPSVEDTEIERRVFWAAFTLDKVQSIYQGRPSRLREQDNSVSTIFLDEFEELEDFSTHTYSAQPTRLGYPTYSVTTFEQLCKLSTIMDRIICALYSEGSSAKGAEELWETARSLHCQLKSWKDGLPEHLTLQLHDSSNSTILPHTLSLAALCMTLVILIHRSFLSEGHLASVSATAAPEAFSNCAKAAFDIHQILQLYRQHFCFKTAPYFISYATYVSATIHVRMAAQKRPGWQAHSCLRTCLEILSIQQTWCHGPKRTMGILLGTMRRLGVSVGDFAAIEPTSCAAEEIQDADMESRGPLSVATTNQPQGTLDLEQPLPNPTFTMPADFEVHPNLELTDFDVDQFMQSFVINDPTSSQQATLLPDENPPFGFVGCAMGDGQFLNQDVMGFDSLFGFGSDVF